MTAAARSGAVLGLAIVGVSLGVGVSELYLRTAGWTPRTQVIRGHNLRLVGDSPLWGDERRTNRACVERYPERLRILLFGSSITYGAEVAVNESFAALLEQRLNEAFPSPGFCVLNFSQPGFQFQQKIVVARAEIPRYRPTLILWEHWVEWRNFRILGDTAYGVSDFRLRPDGFIGFPGVPAALNRFLFLNLQTYRYLAINHGPLRTDLPGETDLTMALAARYMELIELARSTGSELVIYFAPPLDRPFAETAASPNITRTVMMSFAQREGIATYRLEQELMRHDHVELRHDPCCHYNLQGHRVLAAVMERIVMDQLGSSLYAGGLTTPGATAGPTGDN